MRNYKQAVVEYAKALQIKVLNAESDEAKECLTEVQNLLSGVMITTGDFNFVSKLSEISFLEEDEIELGE